MSGNIGEKARAAFLALIMVTSVMAAGVAFSGSAAAGSNDIDAGSASFVSETANSDDTAADHIIRVNVSGTDVGDQDIGGGSIKVDYGEEIGVAAADTTESLGSNNDVSYTLVRAKLPGQRHPLVKQIINR